MMDRFKLQKYVDDKIKEKINVDFNKTIDKRKIAFHVELSELANEIGFFKYWKTSHVMNSDRIKDEWADCLAFLNSLVVTYGFEDELKDIDKIKYSVSINKPEYYYKSLMFNKLHDLIDIECAYKDLFKLGLTLGYSLDELFEAYDIKSIVNTVRAKEGY